MKTRVHTKLIQEGSYVAQVEVELVGPDMGWSPYLTLDDAYKLDDVRDALRRGDIQVAQQHAQVYILTPVAV